MKKKFTALLMKRLVRRVVKILHLGTIDSLDRLHVLVQYENFLCHITLVDCSHAENFPESGLFIQLYEKMSNSQMRLLTYWQLPNSVSSVKWRNLRHISTRAIRNVIRKIITVVRFGDIIPKGSFAQS